MLFLGATSSTLVIFAFILLHPLCDSLSFTEKPDNPTNVILGVNTKEVSLEWNFRFDDDQNKPNDKFGSITFNQIKLVDGQEQKELILRKTSDNLQVETKFKARMLLSGRGTLKIRNVDKDDEAKYECIVVSTGFTTESNNVNLKVLVPPRITKSVTKKVYTQLNKNVTLSCNATGDPSPTFRWVKVGNKKNLTLENELRINNFKLEDVGAYRCIANNGFGLEANATTLVEINCNSRDCQTIDDFSIRMKLAWDIAYTNSANLKYKNLINYVAGEVFKVYMVTEEGKGKKLRQVFVTLREGSVIAKLQLLFSKSGANNPLGPLIDAVRRGKFGDIPVYNKIINSTTPAPTLSTTDGSSVGPPDTGARTSGLSEEAKWGIIGACIAVALIVTVILIICCCCKHKKKHQKGSQSQNDSSFMSTKRSGLGGASPAYAQASAYRQPPYNSSSHEPVRDGNVSYTEVSYANAEPTQKPPRYTSPNAPPEYEESTLSRQEQHAQPDKEKEPGFELWC